MVLHRWTVLVLALLAAAPVAASAQAQAPQSQAPAAQAPAPEPAPTSEQLLKAEELDALVAPIALYPDSLLSLVLMASSYPLEVVQADRWLKENKNLKGTS
jgi:hypothetical protein